MNDATLFYTGTIQGITGQHISVKIHGTNKTMNVNCSFSDRYSLGQTIKLLVEDKAAYIAEYPEELKKKLYGGGDLYGYGENDNYILSKEAVESFSEPITVAKGVTDCCVTPNSIFIIDKNGVLYGRGKNVCYHIDGSTQDSIITGDSQYGKKLMTGCLYVFSNGVRTFVITKGKLLLGWGFNDPYYIDYPKIPCIKYDYYHNITNFADVYLTQPTFLDFQTTYGYIYKDLFVYMYEPAQELAGIKMIGYSKELARISTFGNTAEDIKFIGSDTAEIYSGSPYPTPEDLGYENNLGVPFDNRNYISSGNNFCNYSTLVVSIEKNSISGIIQYDVSDLWSGLNTQLDDDKHTFKYSDGLESKLSLDKGYLSDFPEENKYSFIYTISGTSYDPNNGEILATITDSFLETAQYLSIYDGKHSIDGISKSNFGNLEIVSTLSEEQKFCLDSFEIISTDDSLVTNASCESSSIYRKDYIMSGDNKSLELKCSLQLEDNEINNNSMSNSISFTIPKDYEGFFNYYIPETSDAFIEFYINDSLVDVFTNYTYNIGDEIISYNNPILDKNWELSGDVIINFGKFMIKGEGKITYPINLLSFDIEVDDYVKITYTISNPTGTPTANFGGICEDTIMDLSLGEHTIYTSISELSDIYIDVSSGEFNIEDISIRRINSKENTSNSNMIEDITLPEESYTRKDIIYLQNSEAGNNISCTTAFNLLENKLYELQYTINYAGEEVSLSLPPELTTLSTLPIETGLNIVYFVSNTNSNEFIINYDAKSDYIAIGNIKLLPINTRKPKKDGFVKVDIYADSSYNVVLKAKSFKTSKNAFNSVYIDNIYISNNEQTSGWFYSYFYDYSYEDSMITKINDDKTLDCYTLEFDKVEED